MTVGSARGQSQSSVKQLEKKVTRGFAFAVAVPERKGTLLALLKLLALKVPQLSCHGIIHLLRYKRRKTLLVVGARGC